MWSRLLDWFIKLGGSWNGSTVSCKRGLVSEGICSDISFPSLWKECMKYSSCGNNFPRSIITNLKHRIEKKLTQLTPPTTSRHDTKWTTFTYASPQIRKTTNLFKHTNIKIAFKCNNTIAQLLKPANKTPHHTPYDRSGNYALTCKTCQLAYVGQTS